MRRRGASRLGGVLDQRLERAGVGGRRRQLLRQHLGVSQRTRVGGSSGGLLFDRILCELRHQPVHRVGN
eukprot:scaffold23482_cov63-Phaeocystis_antarctica.AAC.2